MQDGTAQWKKPIAHGLQSRNLGKYKIDDNAKRLAFRGIDEFLGHDAILINTKSNTKSFHPFVYGEIQDENAIILYADYKNPNL